MVKHLVFFWAALAVVFIGDQYIKSLILDGFRRPNECLSIVFTLNKGVAFSMFAFLGPYLKYIQVGLLVFAASFILIKGYLRGYALPLGVLFGAGIGNVYDRFVHGGVVDYLYWHCGFDFAVFNFADVMIDLAVVWILYIHFRKN